MITSVEPKLSFKKYEHDSTFSRGLCQTRILKGFELGARPPHLISFLHLPNLNRLSNCNCHKRTSLSYCNILTRVYIWPLKFGVFIMVFYILVLGWFNFFRPKKHVCCYKTWFQCLVKFFHRAFWSPKLEILCFYMTPTELQLQNARNRITWPLEFYFLSVKYLQLSHELSILPHSLNVK